MAGFQLASDLHIEFRGGLRAPKSVYPVRSADLLVLAGDIYPAGAPEFTEIIRRVAEPFKLVLFVPGNHEYYDCSGTISQMEDMVAQKCNSISNVFCLNNTALRVGDLSFIGATGWHNPPASKWKWGIENMTDYTAIKKKDGTPYVPSEIVKVHQRHVKHIERSIKEAKKSDCSGAVVVTHHAPDVRLSVGNTTRSKDSKEYYYASDMGHLTTDPYVKIWCYGHIHDTKIVRLDPWGPIFACNCKGYPRELGGRFGQYTDSSVIRIDAF